MLVSTLEPESDFYNRGIVEIVKDGYEVERDGGEYPDLLMEFKYDENMSKI